jgi:hypothetical protein
MDTEVSGEMKRLLCTLPPETDVLIVLDVYKAYDNVDLNLLLEELHALDLSESEYRLAKDIVLGWKNLDMELGGLVCLKEKGAPQGGPMATDLWNFYQARALESLAELLDQFSFTYADNWLFVGPSGQLLEAIPHAAKLLAKFGLRFSLKDLKYAEVDELTEASEQEKTLSNSEVIAVSRNGRIVRNFEKLRILGYHFKPFNGGLIIDWDYLLNKISSSKAIARSPPFIGLKFFRIYIWTKAAYHLDLVNALPWPPPELYMAVTEKVREKIMAFTHVLNFSASDLYLMGFHPLNSYFKVRKRLKLEIDLEWIKVILPSLKINMESLFISSGNVEEDIRDACLRKRGFSFQKAEFKTFRDYYSFWVSCLNKKVPIATSTQYPLTEKWGNIATTAKFARLSARQWIRKLTGKQGYPEEQMTENDLNLHHNFRILDALYTYCLDPIPSKLDILIDDQLIRKFLE